jgi:hypothetical protein
MVPSLILNFKSLHSSLEHLKTSPSFAFEWQLIILIRVSHEGHFQHSGSIPLLIIHFMHLLKLFVILNISRSLSKHISIASLFIGACLFYLTSKYLRDVYFLIAGQFSFISLLKLATLLSKNVTLLSFSSIISSFSTLYFLKPTPLYFSVRSSLILNVPLLLITFIGSS